MTDIRSVDPAIELSGDTPTLRLIALLELISTRDRFVSLPDLVEETGLPKPTLHRMLQQLEGAGLLSRQGGGRHYGTGVRLRRLAENLLLNSTHHGARHAVLRALVDEVGETCNITALSGDEVVYLDRVETPEPLRFYLRPGSRVPVHCSASGKVILSQLSESQQRRVLGHAPLKRYTPGTLCDVDEVLQTLETVRRDGYAVDDEEFLPGLVCVAVLVPSHGGRSNLAVAVQVPVMRRTLEDATELLPALRRAAGALTDLETDSTAAEVAADSGSSS